MLSKVNSFLNKTNSQSESSKKDDSLVDIRNNSNGVSSKFEPRFRKSTFFPGNLLQIGSGLADGIFGRRNLKVLLENTNSNRKEFSNIVYKVRPESVEISYAGLHKLQSENPPNMEFLPYEQPASSGLYSNNDFSKSCLDFLKNPSL